MALILPGQQNTQTSGLKLPTSSTRKLVLPGTPEAETKKLTRTKLGELSLGKRKADVEASRSTTSRFLEELGAFGKEAAQSTARSFVATIQAGATKSFDEPFVPRTDLAKKIVGEKPFSFKTMGEDFAPLLQKIGVSEETTKKLSVPLGLFVGALDLYPGLPGKKKLAETALRDLAEVAAKTTDEVVIKKAVTEVMKGSDEAVDALSKTLKDVSDANDARRLIDLSLSDNKTVLDAAKVKIPKTKAFSFVSPNIEENLSFDDALKRLDSPRHAQSRAVVDGIDTELGLSPTTRSAIGDWSDGAENTFFTVYRTVIPDWETLRYSAARRGEALNQKAVIPFLEDAKGADSLFTLDISTKDMVALRKSLDEAGLQFRTLVPNEGGLQVVIFDEGSKLIKNVETIAKKYGTRAKRFRGRGEFLGSFDTRIEGARVYRDVIRGYESGRGITRAGSSGAGSLETRLASGALKSVADDITSRSLSRSQFIDELTTALKQTDTPARDAAVSTVRFMDTLGLTPGKFWDTVVKGGGGALDRVGRELMNVPAPRRILKTESALLNERIKNLARGFREGRSVTRKEIFDLQDEVITLASDNLPVSLRGSLLRTVRNANNPNKLSKALEVVGTKIDEYEQLRALATELSTRKAKIGFLKKVGEFNQTAIKDVKKTLGLEKPIREMSTSELDSVVGELNKRLAFKRERGLFDIPKKPGATKAGSEYLDQFVAQEPKLSERISEGAKLKAAQLKEVTDDFLGVISTQLANIDKSLKYALRKFEYNQRIRTLKDLRVGESFARKVRAMPTEDLQRLDAAMKNGLIENVEELAVKYGFTEELAALRKTLDGIYERANEVGLDVAYRKNFFPRQFKNDELSVKAVLNYFEKADRDGLVQKAIREKERVLGRVLTDAEKVNTINTLLRGFRTSNITLSKTGSLKARILEEVTPTLNQYYEDSITSIFNYIEKVNNLVESRRFFGKHLDLAKMTAEDNFEDVIGSYVNNLVASGKISSIDQLKLERILKARFSSKQMSQALGALKNIGYISVMGSPLNALTQLGDLGLAYYRAGIKSGTGGLYDALRNFFGTRTLTRADVGIDNIAEEFTSKSKLANMVTTVFKAVGLDRIDRLGKETFINGTFRRLRADAIKNASKVTDDLTTIFGDEAQSVVRDLQNGVASENVKYLLFNELLDFQPVALSEVPLKYLESPNGRIFYALKTYTLKLFDIYRREVIQQIKTNPKQGVGNLVKLSASLMVFNAVADELKDAITGQDTDLSDRVVESIAKAFGFNRYTISQVGQEGLGRTFAEQILPPTQLIDDLSKDFKDVFMDEDEDFKVSQLRTIRNIPIGGKLFYWWFGKNGTSKKKKSGGDGIPEIEIPSVEIPTIEIPEISI